MGAGSSKTTPDQSQHVFAADSPVRFSQSVIDSLQNSSETDSVRAHNLELQIQSRVNAELEKVREQEASRLASLTASLTSSEDDSQSESSDPSIGDKIASALTPGSSRDDASKSRSNASVSKEVAELKAKLEKRKKQEKMEPSLEKAKAEMVGCLRMNDRRPLDCYQQVETFKQEVAKLESRFVERAMR